MTELFGRGSREGLLHWIRDGTLLINNVHQAAPHMLPALRRLLADGSYQPAPAPVPLGSMDFPCAERTSPCRVVLTAETRVPEFDGLTTVIQVRVRRRHACLHAAACTTAWELRLWLLWRRRACSCDGMARARRLSAHAAD